MLQQRAARLWASLGLAILLNSAVTAAAGVGPSIPIEYCSTANTGPDTVDKTLSADGYPFHSIYQSEGRCRDNCTDARYGTFALGILQNQDCWCSNLVPNSANQKDTDQCQSPCPGFPSDLCGGSGLFGYIALGNASPTGTAPPQGSSSSSASSSSSSSVKNIPAVKTPPVFKTPPAVNTSPAVKITETETVQRMVPSTVTVPPSSSSSSSDPTTSSSTFSTTPPNGANNTPAPEVQTVTVGGVVRTVTQTQPSPTGTSEQNTSLAATSGGGLSTGGIVGVVLGILAILAIAGILVWWLLMRRRRLEAGAGGTASPSGLGSSSGAGVPRPGESWVPPTNSIVRPGDRRSYLVPVDPRLDPNIYPNAMNKSHESVNSLQDNQDYSRRVHQPSRTLRVTNANPEDD
ncbi:hypothetical protein B0T24DRAFT_679819 [Lasiosphaeria ovina]|uniref:WSC domain-containing protein n=1 Tax=Lasiosphaeria ovina TaxID=92902 RepID=A0AAE0N9K2_9PEZI|nr:hypothetical protein B0T24DRAFT_679819 [Lasiosphaeria ovina]